MTTRAEDKKYLKTIFPSETHSLLSMNEKLMTQYCPGVDMQE